jgi:hypothetical protein
MKTWTATTTTAARPEAVLELLTDPDACARWSPVGFDVDELAGRRLRRGSTARVSGRLAGRRVGFDVEVHAAATDAFALSARGPVGLEVSYSMAPAAGGSEVSATVAVLPGRGLGGRLIAEATGALLTAGALEHAVARLAQEAALAA